MLRSIARGGRGRSMARDRKKNREKKKMYAREERLETRNAFGIKDPTPYEAVLRIRKEDGYAERSEENAI